jgi:rhodanese-related sulfurtransferase
MFLRGRRHGVTGRIACPRAGRLQAGLAAALLWSIAGACGAGACPDGLAEGASAGPANGREAALLADPRAVAEALGSPKAPLLIDVRRAEEHRRFAIPGSLNIPLHALRTKPYLRGEPLVLVGEGHEYGGLAETVRGLSRQGFADVRLLDGGLNFWRRLGYPLTGDVFAAESLRRLDAADYLREEGVDQWLVLAVGGCAALPERVRKAREGYRGAGVPAVLLVGRDGEVPRSALDALEGRSDINLFVLAGGRPALEEARRRARTVATGRGRLASTAQRPLTCP